VEIADGAGGVRTLPARAVPLTGTERDEAYARQAARVPAYGDYARRTDRVIPVIALHPLDLTRPDPERNRAIARQLLAVHATLREQLAALLTGETGSVLTADAPGSAPARGVGDLALHCLAFCDALGSHHATEEAVLPSFDTAFPHLAPVLDRLRAEHRQVAAAIADLRGLLADPAADGVLLARRIAELAADTERHFAYEEEHLLAALLAG
jgi:hypothetical protein